MTTVGSAGAVSHYGTFDQGGNVWEWNDTIVSTTVNTRGKRGGGFDGFTALGLNSGGRPTTHSPTAEDDNFGFRVSSLAAIPEPSAYAAILGCLGLTLALTRRKGRV